MAQEDNQETSAFLPVKKVSSIDETQKRPQVNPVTPLPLPDTDSIAPIEKSAIADAIFEELVRQYVNKYLKHWLFPAQWVVDIVVVTRKQMRRFEAMMEWDDGGIPWARLTIRRDIDEDDLEHVVMHEIIELFSREDTNVVRAMAAFLPENIKITLYKQYCKVHNEMIETVVTSYLGPRKAHLTFEEDDTPPEHPVVTLPSLPPIESSCPSFATDAMALREINTQWDLDEEIEEDEEDEKEEEIPVVAKEDKWLLDDEDREIIQHLHASQPSTFFTDQTNLVLPVTPIPSTSYPYGRLSLPSALLADQSSPSSTGNTSGTKFPFSRQRLERLTPEQEQNQAWKIETIQQPSATLPVVKENTPELPQQDECMAKNEGKSAWEEMIARFRLAQGR